MRKYNDKVSKRINDSLNKREKVVRRQKCILAIVILVVVSFGILLGTSMNVFASSKEDISKYNKYYKSVRIEAGDTLWSIADEHVSNFNIDKKEYMKEICELNHMSIEDDIHAGDFIVVAYYSKDVK